MSRSLSHSTSNLLVLVIVLRQRHGWVCLLIEHLDLGIGLANILQVLLLILKVILLLHILQVLVELLLVM